jgi:hypothetical protein
LVLQTPYGTKSDDGGRVCPSCWVAGVTTVLIRATKWTEMK